MQGTSGCVDGEDGGGSKDAVQNVHVSSLANVFDVDLAPRGAGIREVVMVFILIISSRGTWR